MLRCWNYSGLRSIGCVFVNRVIAELASELAFLVTSLPAILCPASSRVRQSFLTLQVNWKEGNEFPSSGLAFSY